MKLVSFFEGGTSRFGAVIGDKVVDLHAADSRIPTRYGAFLRGGGDLALLKDVAAKAKAGAMRELIGLDFDLAVPDPGKILCLGLNYMEHVKEGTNQPTEYPTIFMRGRTSLVAHQKPIIRPAASDKLDFEAELAVIIGKTVRHATLENALDAVAGYTCFNDGTLRDYQRKTTQWTVGKNFDQTGGFGPFVLTPDALPKGAIGLAIQSRLNGQVMQSDNTRNMMFPVAQTIATITEAITLEPGDVIVMGTPSGVGYARKPPVFMKPGDEIEIEIEGIGTLRNPIAE